MEFEKVHQQSGYAHVASHAHHFEIDSKSHAHVTTIEKSHTHNSFGKLAMKRLVEMSQHKTFALDFVRQTVNATTRSVLTEIQKLREQIMQVLQSIRKRNSETNNTFSKRFESFLIVEMGRLLYMLRRAMCAYSPPKAFVQQILSNCSVMLTGPPVTPTGLPVFNSVTTWGRVI
jgi:hypothetical protein